MKFARVLEEKSDWRSSISSAEREAVNEALVDIDKGKTIPHDQIRKLYGQHL